MNVAGKIRRRPVLRAIALLLGLAASTAIAGDVPANAQQQEEARRAAQERAQKAAREAAAQRLAMLAQRNIWTDEQFEQWVFSQDGNAGNARRRFENQLALQIEEINQVCHLSDAQMQKMRLMGHGDLKRVFDVFDTAKHHFNAVENDTNRLQDVMQDIRPVQLSVQNGLFNEDSLLAKSLHHVLTADQAAKYDVVAKDRRAYWHRARVELAVGMLEQGLPLRDAQRRGLIDLLVKETKPSRGTNGVYDFYLVMYHIGRLPEDKIKPLFSAAEWKILDRQLAQYKGIVPNLRANGMLDEDDDAAEARAAAER
jgi:hypothetical protein